MRKSPIPFRERLAAINARARANCTASHLWQNPESLAKYLAKLKELMEERVMPEEEKEEYIQGIVKRLLKY
jgi:hypothetical protein